MKTFEEKNNMNKKELKIEEKIEELRKFCEENKELPRSDTRLYQSLMHFKRKGDIRSVELYKKYKKVPTIHTLNFSDVVKFCETHHRLPNSSGANKVERALERIYLKNKEMPEAINLLKKFGRTKGKYLNISDFVEFCKTNNRLPKNMAGECGLFSFWMNNRDNTEIQDIERRFGKRQLIIVPFETLEEFCRKTGRLPISTKEDEKKLYKSYLHGRNRGDSRYIKLGEIYPNNKIGRCHTYEEAEKFCREYNRLPIGNKNNEEKSLYSYMSYHKEEERFSELFKKYKRKDVVPARSFEELEKFCKKHNRRPSGEIREEKGMYAFFLRGCKRGDPKFLKIKEEYPGKIKEKPNYTFEDLGKFCKENNRMPQLEVPEETLLYGFYYRNRHNERFIKLRKLYGKAVYCFDDLVDFCKKKNRLPKSIDKEQGLYVYFKTNLKRGKQEFIDLFNTHFKPSLTISEKIQNFYNQFGRFPKESSIIEEEKVLGEKLIKNPDKALNGVRVTLAPIVYQDFEQFTMAQQCEILSILGLPQQFIDEACEGRKKKATTKTLKDVFKNHGAELVESKDKKEQVSKSITEIGRIKRFSVIMAEYKADPHSPYLINESLNGLWDTIITESKYDSTSTYNELVSDTEQTEFFNIIKNQLVEEYKKAIEYIPSREYSGKYNPDLMQRLCIIRLRKKKYYANWSKTGTGKTLQSLLSSLDIDSKITLYILPNSTVSDKAGTKKKDGAIKEFVPNSNVIIYNGSTSLKSIIPSKRNYILVNYDKLSRVRFLRPLEDLAKEGKIDFICVDEVQMAKSRGDKAASNRNKALLALRRLAEDYNPNLYVLGLTATPVINNLYEVKTLCEIITGKSLGDDGLFSGNTISFAAAQTAHKYIVNYGFRYNYDYSKEIAEKETIIPIRGGKDLYNRINEINDKFKNLGKSRRGMAGIKELEDSQIILKLEACKHLIKPGVVIYTQYVGGEKENNTITIINRWLRQNGLESVLYTGQMNDLTEDEETGEQIKIRDEELQRFIGDPEKGIIGTNKTKVLIASSVLRTGVDGLQKVSNTIIMLSLPWTYADYEQLKGRFIRRNSNFNEVNIYIPTVSLKLTTGEWSWDKSKWEILQYKKDLSDLIIYGNYCDSNILRIAQTETERSLIEKALSQIDAPLEIYSEEIHPDIDYREVKRRLGNPKPYRRPKGSCIIHIHKRYDTMDTIEIEGDMAAPERRGSMIDYWIDQDKIVGKKGYVDSNTETAGLINDIYGGPDKKVADLGCGPHDPLRKLVTNCEEFFSCTFEPEEVTLPLDVVRCDSTRLNMVEDKYFDVVNHTNSHWGTNLNDYVLEDYRILKDDGVLIITSVCPPRKNKYKIIANAYLESGLWEYLVEPVRFGGKSGMTRGIFKKKGI